MNSDPELYSVKLSPIHRYAYLISGFLLVGIGFVGIFVPLLPTTIFLILASYCFVRSSPKANEWLKNHKLLGIYVDNYQNKTGLTRTTKIVNIFILWLSISFSAFFFTDELYIKIILFIIAVGVTIHLLMIKTKTQLDLK